VSVWESDRIAGEMTSLSGSNAGLNGMAMGTGLLRAGGEGGLDNKGLRRYTQEKLPSHYFKSTTLSLKRVMAF